jgi:hypothetical protein
MTEIVFQKIKAKKIPLPSSHDARLLSHAVMLSSPDLLNKHILTPLFDGTALTGTTSEEWVRQLAFLNSFCDLIDPDTSEERKQRILKKSVQELACQLYKNFKQELNLFSQHGLTVRLIMMRLDKANKYMSHMVNIVSLANGFSYGASEQVLYCIHIGPLAIQWMPNGLIEISLLSTWSGQFREIVQCAITMTKKYKAHKDHIAALAKVIASAACSSVGERGDTGRKFVDQIMEAMGIKAWWKPTDPLGEYIDMVQKDGSQLKPMIFDGKKQIEFKNHEELDIYIAERMAAKVLQENSPEYFLLKSFDTGFWIRENLKYSSSKPCPFYKFNSAETTGLRVLEDAEIPSLTEGWNCEHQMPNSVVHGGDLEAKSAKDAKEKDDVDDLVANAKAVITKLDPLSPEFKEVEKLFLDRQKSIKTVSSHDFDPIKDTFKVTGIDKITNDVLTARFIQHVQDRPTDIGFFATPSMSTTCDFGPLPIGHPLYGSSIDAKDRGSGAPQTGIMMFRRPQEACIEVLKSSDAATQIVLCKVFSGNSHWVQRETRMLLPTSVGKEYDSFQLWNVWHLFRAAQCLPTYIVTFARVEEDG